MDILSPEVPFPQQDNRSEYAHIHSCIGQHVEHNTRYAVASACNNTKECVACMRDTGVCEHPFYISLYQCKDASGCHCQNRYKGKYCLPASCHRAKRL